MTDGLLGRPELPSRRAVDAFVVFAVAMSVKALYLWFPGAPSNAPGPSVVPIGSANLLYVMTWLLLYGIAVAVLARQLWQHGIPARLLAVFPFAFYAMVSSCWAEDRAASALPATMLALDVVVAAALASLAHPARLLRLMVGTNIVLALLSLVTLILIPAQVTSDPTRPGLLMSGELFGVYDTKGTLCTSAAISLVVLMSLSYPHRLWLRAGGAVVLGLALLFANAAGPLVAATAASGILLATRAWPRLRIAILATSTGIALFLSIVLPFINVSDLTALVGRSADLTGRTSFWPMAPDIIRAHPLFGYGYAAFFHQSPYAAGWTVWDREQWFFTPEFHNAFLDVLVGLGVIGALFYVAIVFGAATVMANRTLPVRCIDMLVACLIVFIICNATEFQLLAHNSNATLFLLYCFFVAGRRYGPPVWDLNRRVSTRPAGPEAFLNPSR